MITHTQRYMYLLAHDLHSCWSWTVFPTKEMLKVLSPRTCEYDPICKSSLCRCSPVKIQPRWNGAGPAFSMTGVFIRRDTSTRGGEQHEDTTGEENIMWHRRQKWKPPSFNCQPRISSKPSEDKQQGRNLPQGLQREHSPADILISNLKPPGLWNSTFLSF